MHLDDDLVELHHAIVDVVDTAVVGFTQLSGRVPCRTGTEATTPAPGAQPPRTLPAGSVITIGASRLRLGGVVAAQPARPAALTPRRGDPWRVSLHRPPRQPVGWAPTPVAPPSAEIAHSRYASGGLLAALLSVAGGVSPRHRHRPSDLPDPQLCRPRHRGRVGADRRVRSRTLHHRSAADARRDLERFAADLAAQATPASSTRAQRAVTRRGPALRRQPDRPAVGAACRPPRRAQHPSRARLRDLTLECIRRYYVQQDSPLAPVLSRYADFFRLFGDFRGYVSFFLLEDLVTDDGGVRFFMPFDDFRSAAVPKDVGTYAEYRRRSIEFIEARNDRVEQLNV